jgi:hypothetical protein
MTWTLTPFGEEKFKNTELKIFLSNKPHNFIPDTFQFVLEGMGVGHFYLEDYSVEARKPAATIFFNEDHIMCLHDAIVARWV